MCNKSFSLSIQAARIFLAIAVVLAPPTIASECTGFFNKAPQIPSSWSYIGDQFNSLVTTNTTSWGRTTVGEGTYYLSGGQMNSTFVYALSMPSTLQLPSGEQISVSALSTMSRPLGNGWTAYYMYRTSEIFYCYSSGISYETIMGAGSMSITLRGAALPSGEYSLQLPYNVSWSGDTYGTPDSVLFQNMFRHHTPGPNLPTGFFNISFIVNNRCDLSDTKDITLDHGRLYPTTAPGSLASSERVIICGGDTEVSFAFPSTVPLGNGLSSKLSITDRAGIPYLDKKIKVKANESTPFRIQSVLNSESDTIEAGQFSKSAVLVVTYP